ncbi:hypothetical protein OCU04_001289 [Sclerotinia nivalis]|uniref:Uncharacterized protein n=1 Tax=Sclerotinia nivalis TaxID=352851 RepID=A0A9X0AXU4_9HELO|nr:hypothetical protein OCU04_001289 [Sclerotinia nivalis]
MSVDAEMDNLVTTDSFPWIEARDLNRQFPSDLMANRQDPDWASLDSFPWIESRETSEANGWALDSSQIDQSSADAIDCFPWIRRWDGGNGINDEDSLASSVRSDNVPCIEE